MFTRNSFVVICFITSPLFSYMPNTVIDNITGFTQPIEISITPNGQLGYVADNTGNSVRVIDLVTTSPTYNTVIDTITGFNGPNDIGLTPDGLHGYVTNFNNSTVSILDLTTNTIIGTVSGTFSGCSGITIAPNGSAAYVVNTTSHTLSVVDLIATHTSYNSVVATLFNVTGIVGVTPDSQNGYAPTASPNTSVEVIDLADNIVTTTIAGLTTPSFVIVKPDGTSVYVASSGSSIIYEIDAVPTSMTYNTVIGSITAGLSTPIPGMAITPNSSYAYIPNRGSNNLSVADLRSTSTAHNTVILQILGLNNPRINAITPNGSYVYTTNLGGGSFVNVVFIQAPMTNPSGLSGQALSNGFLMQKDLINSVSWQAPVGSPNAPVSYSIYRDAGLTDLVVTVPAGVLSYLDHNRTPNTTYSYYIVAEDQYGDVSPASSITVT